MVSSRKTAGEADSRSLGQRQSVSVPRTLAVYRPVCVCVRARLCGKETKERTMAQSRYKAQSRDSSRALDGYDSGTREQSKLSKDRFPRLHNVNVTRSRERMDITRSNRSLARTSRMDNTSIICSPLRWIRSNQP